MQKKLTAEELEKESETKLRQVEIDLQAKLDTARIESYFWKNYATYNLGNCYYADAVPYSQLKVGKSMLDLLNKKRVDPILNLSGNNANEGVSTPHS